MRKRAMLRLVSKEDAGKKATDIFDDMEALRASATQNPAESSAKTPKLKDRKVIEFVMVPYAASWKLCETGILCPEMAIILELDRLIYEQHTNPVLLHSPRLAKIGVKGQTRARALKRLEEAGAIRVNLRGLRKCPSVTLLWKQVRESICVQVT
jgi:hypothetical protein